MDRYVEQLIEELKKAESNPTPEPDFGSTYQDFEIAMLKIEEEENLPSEQILNVSYEELPPVERLSWQQIQDLLIAIINALSAKGIHVNIPSNTPGNGVPVELVYSQIREKFKEGFHAMPGWVVDFCSGYCPSCAFADYCKTCKDIWNKEELEKERVKYLWNID